MANEPNPTKEEKAAEKAAQDLADRAAKIASERAAVAACKALLEPLSMIQIDPPGYAPGGYSINRAGHQVKLTNGDIHRAVKCMEDPDCSLETAKKAMEAIAKLPNDFTVADQTAPLYAFPDGTGTQVTINNAQILAARKLIA